MDTEKLLPLPGRDCGPETGHVAIRTDESILAWGRANLARAEAENQRLREALEIIANLSMSQFYKPQDLGNAAIKLASAALTDNTK